MKKPVIASCVDGISETIIHNQTGILLHPKPLYEASKDGLKHLEFIVNKETKKIQKPKAIDSDELAQFLI